MTFTDRYLRTLSELRNRGLTCWCWWHELEARWWALKITWRLRHDE